MRYTPQFILLPCLLFACSKAPEAEKKAAAAVSSPVKESALTTVTLTPEAEKNLGIRTVTVGSQEVTGTLEMGGDVQAEPGQAASITAPMKGILALQKGSPIPQTGRTVKKGEVLYRLTILPAEGDLANNNQELEMRRVQLETARNKANRMRQLLKDGAVSERAKQEAEAELAMAQKAYQDAVGKRELLQGGTGQSANQSVFVIKAPLDGVIQRVYAGQSQTVAAGAPLLDIAGLNPVWVRVPVYMGDLERINLNQPAQVRTLAATGRQAVSEAMPVSTPVASGSTAALTDIFYEIKNTDKSFYPGQKVMVSLPTKGKADGMVVPYAAIVYDINGGEWVYVQTGPQVYQRQRVQVQSILRQQAVISKGVEAGMRVVTDGAAELFGTEFGGGK
ncbi:efflux RND transporter periplasmic adaptor subunit [Pontibacter mangrovi]|uniref:Efflux RND transporter periplasmic adaptor subunit n=2 Tax=Pseudomonadati TaxID=3379134 RepID=A0A501WJW7_9RHOB|nr:efflux RND transporter periplasmic adaptor subunit [Pontibacter mangrovi]TPE41542.1 efflux RND transporter periplasmic adaptor subunit [Pontibacter mangrovi]TPE48670.1 efflux RND transporter periplasmic adaptor subunit [Amaricoccus solimangrovi]